MLLSILRLLIVDAYVFYRPVSAKMLTRHTGKNGSVLLYLLRYLLTNKNYLVNTADLCAVAAFQPAMLGQFDGLSIMTLSCWLQARFIKKWQSTMPCRYSMLYHIRLYRPVLPRLLEGR